MSSPISLELLKMFFYVKQNAMINNDGNFDMPSYEMVKGTYPTVTTIDSYLAAVEAAGPALEAEYKAYVKEEVHGFALSAKRDNEGMDLSIND